MKVQKRLTRDEKRERTRQELLNAAGRVFAKRGYWAASLDEVADEAGYSKGAVYSNFDSKEQLFLTLVQEHMREHLEGANAAFSAGETLIERLQSGSDYLASVVEQDREWCLLLMEFWGQAVRDPELREVFAADYESWRENIAQLIETQSAELGLPLSAPAADLASAMIAFYEGLVLQKMIDPARFERGFIAQGLLIFAAGVAAMAGADVEQLMGTRSLDR